MITLQKLIILHACSKQVEKFKEVFGDSVVPTEALALAHARDFDWNWAASRLLSQEGYAEYYKARALAWDEYEKAIAPAWDKYKKACALAFVRLYLSEN